MCSMHLMSIIQSVLEQSEMPREKQEHAYIYIATLTGQPIFLVYFLRGMQGDGKEKSYHYLITKIFKNVMSKETKTVPM